MQILSQAVCERLQSAQGLDGSPATNINFTTLATQTEGYSPTDLKDLTSVAFHQATMRLVSTKNGGPLVRIIIFCPCIQIPHALEDDYSGRL